MSSSTAKDLRDMIIALVKGKGLLGQHTHSATEGGWISTDGPIKHRNALTKPIDTNSQILNENLNADLWRGHRFYNLNPPPTTPAYPRTDGDLDFDGTNFWIWDNYPTPQWRKIANITDIPSSFPATPHPLLDANFDSDTSAHTPTAGDTVFANGSNLWDGLTIGGSAQLLTVVSGLPSWQNSSFAKHFMLMGG